MSKARTEANPPSVGSKELRVCDLAGELHDRVGEASALVNAVNIIASTTSLDAASLGRLRHVILVALGAVTEAADITSELTALVRS